MTETPSTSPTSTRTTAVLVVVVAFIAGLFVGIAGDRFYLFRRGRFFPPRAAEFATRRMVDRLDRQLHLNPQQKVEIQKIIDQSRTRVEGIMGNVRPQLRQEIDSANAQIAKVLTPQQRQEFSKMRMRLPGPPHGRGRHDRR